MGKDIEKNLVGQPIFKQLLNLLPRDKFDLLVNQHKSDRYYKAFSSWDELVTLLFGILSRCDSMGEVCDGMQTLQGKLNYLGMDRSPAKSTAGDGLRERDNSLFKEFYFKLIAHFEPVLSVSRIHGVSFTNFYAFDSTTISLLSVERGWAQPQKRWQEKRWAESPHDDRCPCQYGKICHDKRGKNARQEFFEAPDTAKREHDSVRQSLQPLLAICPLDKRRNKFCVPSEG